MMSKDPKNSSDTESVNQSEGESVVRPLGKRQVPKSEYRITTARSGGPGGQNVNKVETKAELRWDFWNSKIFSYAEKVKIARSPELRNRINNDGEVVIQFSEARTQGVNRQGVLDKLHALLKKALVVKTKRKATKPTKASKEKRLSDKKKRQEKKQSRKSPSVDE